MRRIMTCRAVEFCNREGLRLRGIVHLPETRRVRTPAVILLSPGVKYRVAPHRLYVKLARHLERLGYAVLRFDFAGLGDSEGTLVETGTADFYGTVQSGRYVEDTRCAMDWMAAEYGISRFVLAGLCGGAITGLLAGASDPRVESLVALGLPVQLDSTSVDPSRYLTTGELEQWREGYRSKLRDPRSWLRLLTFRSNYRVILRVLTSARRTSGPSKATSLPVAEQTPADNFNRLVPPALEAMIRDRRVLLIFGEADRLHSIYEERLACPYESMLRRHGHNVELHVVPGANHTFSLPVWEESMRRHVEAWLEARCPSD